MYSYRSELARPLAYHPGLPVGNAAANSGFSDWLSGVVGQLIGPRY